MGAHVSEWIENYLVIDGPPDEFVYLIGRQAPDCPVDNCKY